MSERDREDLKFYNYISTLWFEFILLFVFRIIQNDLVFRELRQVLLFKTSTLDNKISKDLYLREGILEVIKKSIKVAKAKK